MQDYRLSTLDGGERVVTERLDRVRSVAIGFWIGTGSRDEDDARAGVSHFLEHLLFKGTRSYSAQDIAETFDGIGGELNALTTREYTVVYARVMDEHLETAVDVMTDMVYAPALVDLDSEREVVLEEIAMVEDAPQELVHDLAGTAIFGAHPLGRPIIGRADVIESVSRRALQAFHRARYVGPSTVVAAAGSVDHDRLVELLRARAAKRAAPQARAPKPRQPGDPAPRPQLVFQRKDTEQYHVCVGAPGISRADPRRFAASILDGILGGSASSRLFQEIREKRGLAYNVYTFASLYAETGEVGIYVGTREENLAECFAIVAREIGDVASGAIGAPELTRAKENLKGRIMLSMESTSNRVTRLGKSMITETELLSLDEIIGQIEAVQVEDVATLALELLAPERLSVAAIGPNAKLVRRAVGRLNPSLETVRGVEHARPVPPARKAARRPS
jgi:predicted Zn-dependent peptidase